MKQITEQIFSWSEYRPERHVDANGHFVRGETGQPGVLLDPVPPQAGDRDHMQDLGGVAAALLTSSGSARGGGVS